MVIFVLCFTSIAYGQEKIPESQTIIIIEKMHELENRLRDYIDKKFTEQNKKFTEQNKTITALGKEVAVNGKQIELMNDDIKELQGTLSWIWRGVIGVIILNIGWYLIQHFFLKQPNIPKQDVSESAKDHGGSEKYTDDTQTDLKENMGEAA